MTKKPSFIKVICKKKIVVRGDLCDFIAKYQDYLDVFCSSFWFVLDTEYKMDFCVALSLISLRVIFNRFHC